MKWNHIMDCQPEDGHMIIQCDAPYDGHYNLGMRRYFGSLLSWNLVLLGYKNNDWPLPDFWWVYAEDFPFPDKMDLTK